MDLFKEQKPVDGYQNREYTRYQTPQRDAGFIADEAGQLKASANSG